MGKNTEQASAKLVDILLCCAVEDESEQLLSEIEKSMKSKLSAENTATKQRLHIGELSSAISNTNLRTAIYLLPKMGHEAVLKHLPPILNEYKPNLAIMTGICAADRRSASLGDIVIPERIYWLAGGKITPDINLETVDSTEPNDHLVQFVKSFREGKDLLKKAHGRPSRPVLREQLEWLINALLDKDDLEKIPKSQLEKNVPDLKRVLEILQSKLPQSDSWRLNGNSFADKAAAKAHVQKLKKFPYKDPRKCSLRSDFHMVSFVDVREDEPFQILQNRVGRAAKSLEMEAFHFIKECKEKQVDALVVKAVQDYAYVDKDDSFRFYGSRLAARYALEFARYFAETNLQNGNGELIPKSPATEQTTSQERIAPNERSSENIKKTVLIDFSESDVAPANWLAKKLLVSGYQVWCRSISASVGSNSNAVFDQIAKEHSHSVLFVLSKKALDDRKYLERRIRLAAMGLNRIPVKFDELDLNQLDTDTSQLRMADCGLGWGKGLVEIMEKLDESGLQSADHLLKSGIPRRRLIEAKPELLASNQYRICQFPKTIKQYRSKTSLDSSEVADLLEQWPAKQITEMAYWSFAHPGAQLRKKYGLLSDGEKLLSDEETFQSETERRNIIKELCKKSIESHCILQGLVHCFSNDLVYFKQDSPAIKFNSIIGKPTRVNPTGERSVKRSGVPVPYRYQQAPMFDIRINKAGTWVLIRIRVRLTDAKGQLLKPKLAISRRKHLCKTWWNEDWLKRSMAVMQFLSKDGNTIVIGGPGDDCLKISALPDTFEIPMSLNESALKNQDEDEREEVLMSERTDEEVDPDWNDGDEDDE